MSKLLKSIFLTVLMTVGTSLFAQDCDYGIDPNCEEADAPIDSGVGLLIGAVALYSAKKIKEQIGETD